MCCPAKNTMSYGLIGTVFVCVHLVTAASASSTEYRGYIEAASRADVYSRAEGIVDEVFAQQGDYVLTGDPLLRLRQDLKILEVQSAEAELIKAEALLAQAAGRVERIAKLSTSGTSSNVAAIEAQTQFILAKAERDLAKSALARAQTELADTVVRAPISGYVEDPSVGIGSLVEFSSGDPPLFQIVNLDPVNVVFEVPYAPSITEPNSIHSPANFRRHSHQFDILDNSGRLLASGVAVSSSAVWVDTQSGTIRAWAKLENSDSFLRPGMVVKAVPRQNQNDPVQSPARAQPQDRNTSKD